MRRGERRVGRVMCGMNPQGCQVLSFKHPGASRLFAGRYGAPHVISPERGRIGIFNRSCTEEVVIARVHPEILREQRAAGRAARRKGGLA